MPKRRLELDGCGYLEVSSDKETHIVDTSLLVDDVPGVDALVGLDEGEVFSLKFTNSLSNGSYVVVPSMNGVNPLNGLKADGNIQVYGRGIPCPSDNSHGCLGSEGWCSKCGVKYPYSNYVSVKTVEELRGWHVSQEEVRDFVATYKGEGVAQQLLEWSAVDVIGLALYKSSDCLTYYGNLFGSTPWLQSKRCSDNLVHRDHTITAGSSSVLYSTSVESNPCLEHDMGSVAAGQKQDKNVVTASPTRPETIEDQLFKVFNVGIVPRKVLGSMKLAVEKMGGAFGGIQTYGGESERYS